MIPREDVREAETIPNDQGKPRIEYHPTRPKGRLRYSLAHEIAHTIFPDWADRVRKRAPHSELQGDDWQLEALCNIAAAEFVMPIGSFTDLATPAVGVDALLEEQKRYEARVRRIVETRQSFKGVAVIRLCSYRRTAVGGQRVNRLGDQIRPRPLPRYPSLAHDKGRLRPP